MATHGIQPGKAEVARAASEELASHLQANHPTYLKFQITLSEDGERMTVNLTSGRAGQAAEWAA